MPPPIDPMATHAYSYALDRWMPCVIVIRHDTPKRPAKYPLIVTVNFIPDPSIGYPGGLEDVAAAHVKRGRNP